MAIPTSRQANGSSVTQPVVKRDVFKILVENVTDTIFLIDLETEECIYVSPASSAAVAADTSTCPP